MVNDTKGGIDLTVHWPVAKEVVDMQERQFDPIDGLYNVEGNPGCNDLLQLGFGAPMNMDLQSSGGC